MLTSGLRRMGRVRGRRQGSEWVRLHVRRRARHAAAAAIRRDKSQESPGSGRTAHGRGQQLRVRAGQRGEARQPGLPRDFGQEREADLCRLRLSRAALPCAAHGVGRSAGLGSLRVPAFHAPLITMDWLCFFASICSYAALVTWYACGGKAPAS